MNNLGINRVFGNISFWIGIFFFVHLIGIWYPPIEAAHSWRQATGLMVARNYFENNTSFFFPMVDETNGGSGIIGMEFPILYYMQGKLGMIFGFHAGIGRLINVLISSIGLGYFYALLLRFIPRKASFYATLLLGVSCFFMYSRKVMPDTAAMAVYIIGVFYFFEALQWGRWKDTIWSLLFMALGFLLKISVVPWISITFFAYFYFRNKPKKAWILFLPLISLLPAVCWYFIWNPYLALHYGNWYNLGGSFLQGADAFFHEPKTLLHHLSFHPFFSYLAFFLCCYGIWRLFRTELDISVKITIPIFLLVFLAYALKSGKIFLSHEYYIIPFVPLMAVLGGITLANFRNYAWLLMLLIAIEAIANQGYDFKYNHKEAYKLKLSALANRFIPQKALVVINGNSNPQELYFLHRKGWNIHTNQLSNSFLGSIKQYGAAYLIINKHSAEDRLKIKMLNAKLLMQNADYLLFRL